MREVRIHMAKKGVFYLDAALIFLSTTYSLASLKSVAGDTNEIITAFMQKNRYMLKIINRIRSLSKPLYLGFFGAPLCRASGLGRLINCLV